MSDIEKLQDALRGLLLEVEALSQRTHNFLASNSEVDKTRLIDGLVHVGVSLPTYAAILRETEITLPALSE